MTELLKTKTKVRGGHRAHTSKLIAECKVALDNYEPSLQTKIKTWKATLQEKETTLKELDEAIFELVYEDEILKEIETASTFTEQIKETIVFIDDKLTAETSQPWQAAQAVQDPTTYKSKGVTHARLPKLVIKKFGGQPWQWLEVWDSFVASVHNNEDLSDAERFSYLKSLLEGPAYSTVAGLALTSTNYEKAIDILKSRYGQRQVIINSHMEHLLNLQAVTDSRELRKLRKLYDTIEQDIRGLRSLDVEVSSYGSLLISVIQGRLPRDILIDIGKEMNLKHGGVWNPETLMESLKLEIETRECVKIKGSFKESSSHTRKPGYGKNTSIPQTSAALLGGNSAPDCTFCLGKHPSFDCHVVTNLQEQKNILRETGRCFLCLRRGSHISRDCKSSVKCHICNGHHHVSLCFRNPKVGGVNNMKGAKFRPKDPGTSRQNEIEQTETKQCEPSQVHTGHISTEETGSNQTVLLQTAKAYLTAAGNFETEMAVRVLIDGGSQRTYISKDLRNN